MPRMFGKRIMLREFEQNDLPEMRKWVTDPDSTRYLSGGRFTLPNTWDETAKYLDTLLAGTAPGVHMVIADLMSGDYLGQCDLMGISQYARRAELAIVLGPEHQGKGYGGEAIDLLLELAFNWLNLNRVTLRVYTDNQNAVRLYERHGFVTEGILRQDEFVDGQYRDVAAMAILKQDWQRTLER